MISLGVRRRGLLCDLADVLVVAHLLKELFALFEPGSALPVLLLELPHLRIEELGEGGFHALFEGLFVFLFESEGLLYELHLILDAQPLCDKPPRVLGVLEKPIDDPLGVENQLPHAEVEGGLQPESDPDRVSGLEVQTDSDPAGLFLEPGRLDHL